MSHTKLLAACVAASFLAIGCGESSESSDTGNQQEEIFEPTALALEADKEAFVRGAPVQLVVVGSRDGKTREITEGVQFSSSNEQVATVDETGLVTVHAGGDVTLKAVLGSLEATWEVTTSCNYPRFAGELKYDEVFPALSWPAKRPDGTDFTLDMKKVHCDLDWAPTKTITFVVSAGWCSPCTIYAQRLEKEVAELRSLGMELVIVEAQDYDFLPADLEFAWDHLNKITTEVPSIVVGDADTTPVENFFNTSEAIKAFPSTFVIRTRDMKVIADSRRADSYLPLAQIAADPEADWSNSGEPVFKNNCGAGVDEETETATNDTPETATGVDAGSHPGGICTDAADFYEIGIDGRWSLSLDFDQSVGDLDVFVWDVASGQPLQVGNQVVGSATSESPEAFEHEGRVIVAVQGYRHASAPYTLTLTSLE